MHSTHQPAPAAAAVCAPVGVLLHELCCGVHPERGKMLELEVPHHCPQEVKDLVARCLEQVGRGWVETIGGTCASANGLRPVYSLFANL